MRKYLYLWQVIDLRFSDAAQCLPPNYQGIFHCVGAVLSDGGLLQDALVLRDTYWHEWNRVLFMSGTPDWVVLTAKLCWLWFKVRMRFDADGNLMIEEFIIQKRM